MMIVLMVLMVVLLFLLVEILERVRPARDPLGLPRFPNSQVQTMHGPALIGDQ